MSPSRLIPAEALRARRLSRFPYPALAPLPEAPEPPPEGNAEALSPEARVALRLREAERQAEALGREAYERGHRAGEAAGHAAGVAEHRAAMDRLAASLAELETVAGRLTEALDEEVLALTLAVGEHLALQHLSHAPEALQALLRGTLEALPFPLPRGRREGDAPLQVFLHPEDLDLLGEAPRSGLVLRADADLARGGLRVEAPLGVFDASLERRRQLLLDALRGAP